MASVLKRVRITVAVASAAAGLVLTGCSSDSGDDSGRHDATPQASTSASAGGGETTVPGTGDGKGLEGSWLATKDGNAIALVITAKKAALIGSGGTVCNGTAGDEMGMQMIHLACPNGNKDRAEGHVKSVDAKKLTISWEGFGDEEYQRTEGGQMPSGMPTA